MSVIKPNSIIYAGGAMRSERKPRYRDIPFEFLERIAAAFTRGVHYEEAAGLPPWDKNWEHGDTEFALDALDHAIEHLYKYKERIRARLIANVDMFDDEDHLGHCGANLAMLAFYESRGFLNYQYPTDTAPSESTPAPEPEAPAPGFMAALMDKIKAIRAAQAQVAPNPEVPTFHE